MRALFIISVAAVAAAGCAHRNQACTGGIGFASNDASKDGTNGEEGGPCAVRVHFDYDSSEIGEGDRPALASSARVDRKL